MSFNVRVSIRKLANIRTGKYQPDDFIIADAKDGDIGFGRAAPGPDRETGRMKPRETHLQAIRDMTASGLVDVMLMSASTGRAALERGPFQEQRRDAGDPAQRHHRHLVGARRPLQGRSLAAPPHGAGRPGEEISSISGSIR